MILDKSLPLYCAFMLGDLAKNIKDGGIEEAQYLRINGMSLPVPQVEDMDRHDIQIKKLALRSHEKRWSWNTGTEYQAGHGSAVSMEWVDRYN